MSVFGSILCSGKVQTSLLCAIHDGFVRLVADRHACIRQEPSKRAHTALCFIFEASRKIPLCLEVRGKDVSSRYFEAAQSLLSTVGRV